MPVRFLLPERTATDLKARQQLERLQLLFITSCRMLSDVQSMPAVVRLRLSNAYNSRTVQMWLSLSPQR